MAAALEEAACEVVPVVCTVVTEDVLIVVVAGFTEVADEANGIC